MGMDCCMLQKNKSKTTDDVFVPEFSNHPTVAMKFFWHHSYKFATATSFSITPIVFHHIINTTLQYSVLQNTTLYIKVPYRVLLSATPYCIGLLRTTLYYRVLQSKTKYCKVLFRTPNTTPYQKTKQNRTQYYKILQNTLRMLQRITPHYKVLLCTPLYCTRVCTTMFFKVLHSTAPCYKQDSLLQGSTRLETLQSTTPHYTILCILFHTEYYITKWHPS